MRKKYKNQIFELIKNSDFQIDNFDVTEEEGTASKLPQTVFQYNNSPLKFIIRNASDSFEKFDYQYVPFAPRFIMTKLYPPGNWASFDSVFNVFKLWLKDHVTGYSEDETEVDLWKQFKNGNEFINIEKIDFNERSLFSSDERKQIKASINEFKLLVKSEFKTTKAQQDVIVEMLDYLVDASQRLPKFDWKGLALNILVNISIALTLDTAKGQLLFQLFKKVFNVLPELISTVIVK
jgi:hypothetical protein